MVGRPTYAEHHNRTLTRLLGNRPYLGCYILAVTIFSLGILRDHLYNNALSLQPTYAPLEHPAVRAVAVALFAFGSVLVVSSMWVLGVTGTYLGDYFGILMDEMVTGFPFNVVSDPMYVGSTANFVAVALWYAKPAGLLLSVIVWVTYAIALRFEGYVAELTQSFHRQHLQGGGRAQVGECQHGLDAGQGHRLVLGARLRHALAVQAPRAVAVPAVPHGGIRTSTMDLLRCAVRRALRLGAVLVVVGLFVESLFCGMLLDGAPVAVLPWKHVLVVTAHPDDECMFFGPTLQALLARNVSLSALCLSQGTPRSLHRECRRARRKEAGRTRRKLRGVGRAAGKRDMPRRCVRHASYTGSFRMA